MRDSTETGDTAPAGSGSAAAYLDFLLHGLEFPITALSDVLDVERALIYRWLRGEAEPTPPVAGRLATLADAFGEEKPGSLRGFHRLWKRDLPGELSLHSVLMAPLLCVDDIKRAVDALRPLVDAELTREAARQPVDIRAPHPADLLSEYLEVGPR